MFVFRLTLNIGQIDTDNSETVGQLFDLVNIIIEYIYTLPKKISGIYSTPADKVKDYGQRWEIEKLVLHTFAKGFRVRRQFGLNIQTNIKVEFQQRNNLYKLWRTQIRSKQLFEIIIKRFLQNTNLELDNSK